MVFNLPFCSSDRLNSLAMRSRRSPAWAERSRRGASGFLASGLSCANAGDWRFAMPATIKAAASVDLVIFIRDFPSSFRRRDSGFASEAPPFGFSADRTPVDGSRLQDLRRAAEESG